MSSLWQAAAAILVWLSMGALVYVYLGYPLLLAAIGLFARRPKTSLGYFPKISVLIAAYNEEAGIQKKIEQTLALEYPADKIEIIVLSDCSTDSTDDIVKSFSRPADSALPGPPEKGKDKRTKSRCGGGGGEVLSFL